MLSIADNRETHVFSDDFHSVSFDNVTLLFSLQMRDDRRTSMEGERLSNNSGGIIDGNGSRPLSQTSSEMDTLGPLQSVKHREKAKLQVRFAVLLFNFVPIDRCIPLECSKFFIRVENLFAVSSNRDRTVILFLSKLGENFSSFDEL